MGTSARQGPAARQGRPLGAAVADAEGPDDAEGTPYRLTAALVLLGAAALAFGVVGGLAWAGYVLGLLICAGALTVRYATGHGVLAVRRQPRDRLATRPATGLAGYINLVDSVRHGKEHAEYDRRLRPELTRLAAVRLAERHRIDLRRDPEAAARVIGADLWPLVDPRRAEERPDARPVSDKMLIALVDRLEQL